MIQFACLTYSVIFFYRLHGPHSLLLSGFLCSNSLSQYNGVLNFRGILLDLVMSKSECTVTLEYPGLLPVDPYRSPLNIVARMRSDTPVNGIAYGGSVTRLNFRRANLVEVYDELLYTD